MLVTFYEKKKAAHSELMNILEKQVDDIENKT